jgi:hypothetical protein
MDFCEIGSEHSDPLMRRKCRLAEKVGLTFKKMPVFCLAN